MRLLRRSRCCVLKTGDRRRSFCGQPSRCAGVVPCAHVRGPSHNFTRAAVRQLFTQHWLPSAAINRTRECACLSMKVTGNARHVRYGQNKGRRSGSSSSSSSSGSSSSSPRQRSREGPPGLAMVAATSSTSRVRTRKGWVVIDVERSEEDVISLSLCREGGGCERQ